MPEGVTSSFNPDTGERRETRFRYSPPPPPDYGMGSINWNAVQEMYRTKKAEEAEAATAEAIRFQGMRGYQQALQQGKPAAEALKEFGPMIYWSKPQAFGPSMKAVTPYVQTPWETQRIKESEARINKPTYRAGPNGSQYAVDPKTGVATRIIEPEEESPLRNITVRQEGRKGDRTTISRKVTEAELADEMLVKDVDPLLKQYKEHQNAIDAGDLDYGFFNKNSRKTAMERLGKAIRARGVNPDTGRPLSASPMSEPAPAAKPQQERTESSPYQDGTKLKGPGGKMYIVKDGKPIPL